MDIQYAKDLIISDIITFLVTEQQMSFDNAMSTVYNSVFYKLLQDTETGLYFQSADYNYELLERELKYGSTRFNEI